MDDLFNLTIRPFLLLIENVNISNGGRFLLSIMLLFCVDESVLILLLLFDAICDYYFLVLSFLLLRSSWIEIDDCYVVVVVSDFVVFIVFNC